MFAAAAAAAVLALLPPPGAVAWSVDYETASAAGHRWTERSSTGIFFDVVVEGSLTDTGPGCHALWTRITYDLFPTPPVKRAEICGGGTTPVAVRISARPTTTGSLAVCRGTQNTQSCSAWQSITAWPVRTPA